MTLDFNHFKPCLLISMPQLTDPNFQKAVVLLTDVNKHGAFGIVVNRPTKLTLGETLVLEDESHLNPDYKKMSLWCGGPVEPEKIWVLYDVRTHAEDQPIALGDHMAMAQQIDLLVNHEKTIPDNRFRVYHGYAGWGQGQLEAELAINCWITAPLSQTLVLNTPPDKIWATAIRALGFDPDKLVGTHSKYLN